MIRFVLCLVLTTAAAGCGDDAPPGDPMVSSEITKPFPLLATSELDLLFVIDNSSSMLDEQTTLRQNYPWFMNALETIEGGIDSLHLGVVTTDDPALHTGDCSALDGASFITDVVGELGERERNYSGSLGDAFTCIASVGTDGDDKSAPLDVVTAALAPDGPNPGFVRENALLAIVFITDEDDMSTGDVVDYADTLRGRKRDPSDVLVAGIIAPSPRLEQFLERFPQRNTFQRIDEEDLTGALIQVAERQRLPLGAPCLEGAIQTEPLDCVVTDVRDYLSDEAVETILPACDDDEFPEQSSRLPCYQIAEDPDTCADTETQLAIRVYPLNRRVRGEVTLVTRCAADPTTE